MTTTRLSSKGQVIIPRHIRSAHQWDAGLELQVIEVDDGILLKPKTPFAPTELKDAAGCLRYTGKAKSDEEIQQQMKNAARKAWRDSD